MEIDYSDISKSNYEKILDLSRSRNRLFEKTIITRTAEKFNSTKPIELTYQMKLDIGFFVKNWPYILTLLVWIPLIILSCVKNQYGDALALTFMILLSILITLINHEQVLYKGFIILNNKGIKLFSYNFIEWNQILETYIVKTGSGRNERNFLTLSLKSGAIAEQEISMEFTSPYRKIGHLVESYKMASTNITIDTISPEF